MNLLSAVLLVLLVLVVTPSQAIPKWVWIPDDLFYGSSDNATSRQDVPEQPPIPRTRPFKVKVRDEDNWNLNQQIQNVIYHQHVHRHEGGYSPEGENWEEDKPSNYIKAAGQPNFAGVMSCGDSSCQAFIYENNDVCRKEFHSDKYKYYDYYWDYRGEHIANMGCPQFKQKKYICCKPKPYCRFTSCRDNKYTGKQVCRDLGGGYQFTGHYSYATCGSSFSAYCCLPGHGVPTTGP